MKFPGQRKSKHYFPVNACDPLVAQIQQDNPLAKSHLIGVGSNHC